MDSGPRHPGDFRHLGDDRAHGTTVSAEGEIQIVEEVRQFERVRVVDRATQDACSDFEADEIVIRLRGIVAPRHLKHIKPELDFDVRHGIVFIRHHAAEFLSQLGIFNQ